MTDFAAPADLSILAAQPASKGFDFASVNLSKLTDEAQELELVHPATDKPLGVFLMVRGNDSETFKAAARKEANAERRRAFEAKRKAKDTAVRLVEDDNEAGVRLTATLIAGWRSVHEGQSVPFIRHGDREIEFSERAAIEWLEQFDWAIRQISDFAGDIRNFTKS